MKLPDCQFSSFIIKQILKRRNLTYQDLCDKLKENGYKGSLSLSAVSSKINKGNYSFKFFMACMETFNIGVIQLNEWKAVYQSYKDAHDALYQSYSSE